MSARADAAHDRRAGRGRRDDRPQHPQPPVARAAASHPSWRRARATTGAEHLERLRLIQAMQADGFNLEAIRRLLSRLGAAAGGDDAGRGAGDADRRAARAALRRGPGRAGRGRAPRRAPAPGRRPLRGTQPGAPARRRGGGRARRRPRRLPARGRGGPGRLRGDGARVRRDLRGRADAAPTPASPRPWPPSSGCARWLPGPCSPCSTRRSPPRRAGRSSATSTRRLRAPSARRGRLRTASSPGSRSSTSTSVGSSSTECQRWPIRASDPASLDPISCHSSSSSSWTTSRIGSSSSNTSGVWIARVPSQPVAHPVRAAIVREHAVGDVPDEGSVSWARASSAVRSGPPSGTSSNGSSRSDEGVAVLVGAHAGVERGAARVADADPDRQAALRRLRVGRPAEGVRREFAAGALELAERAPVHVPAVRTRRLDQPAGLHTHHPNIRGLTLYFIPARHLRGQALYVRASA